MQLVIGEIASDPLEAFVEHHCGRSGWWQHRSCGYLRSEGPRLLLHSAGETLP